MSYATNSQYKSTNPVTIAQKKKDDRQKAYKENKGNWEFNFFQKREDPNLEGNIKLSMKPDNGFNPKNVHHYINPELPREEQIFNKKLRGENLKKDEQIIYQNYVDKKTEAVKNDIKALKTMKLTAKPTTKEGKTRLLMMTLENQLQKNNRELVANIFMRLMEDQFEITPEIEAEYSKQISQMNEIVGQLDLIELQFTKFHAQMPPLNIKGFKKFDEWQIQVIKNIDANTSTIVNAPTSAGKSVLSGYATTKGRSLFVVPTDALAWQMSAYIGHILGTNVPIVTATYQTSPARDKMVEILNKSHAIVGTADSIVDYLPFLEKNFKWIIFDEIHMIGKPEGSAMEHIAKILPGIPILALSATIRNTDELVSWFQTLSPEQPISKVICNKRFFNLQRFYYEPETDKLVCLHPLALIEESHIRDGTILNKSLQPTPPNAWDLAQKLKTKFDLGDLNPHVYFHPRQRVELDEANEYFNKLIQFIVTNYTTNKEAVMEVVNSYKCETLTSSSIDLLKLAMRLKNEDKTPAIIFQKNTIACLRLAREFAKELEEQETAKYPKLISERLKMAKIARRMEKKVKHNETDENDKKSGEKDKYNKKSQKEFIGVKTGKKKREGESYQDQYIGPKESVSIQVTSIQEPHKDFTLNDNQYFSEGIVEGWVSELKKYFPNTGDYYHYMIKLLWRGVGVYAKGLPDPYLRLVQSLACQKQLAIVFSDQSLVFGVSMPFRTVVIIRDQKLEDDLEPMLFHQMSGRAGRRGLDKEGNVVFAGYSWERIKELSISEAPVVTGSSKIIYTIPHANRLSEICKTEQSWDKTCSNFLDKSIDEEDSVSFLQGIKSNYEGGWNFAFSNDDVNHLHMNWKLRYSDESVLSCFLIPYLRRAFEGKDHTMENNQINLAHFICRFLSTREAKNKDYALEDPAILSEYPFNQINEQLEDLQIEIPKLIDNRLFISIQQNSIVKSQSEDATDELRHRLMELGEKIKNIQHFCFHSKITGLSKIMGKLLTRIWWIYHTSSPIMKSFSTYDTDEFADVDELVEVEESDDEDSESNQYESDSEDEDSDYE
jgi:hypothetical protein